MGNNQYAKTQYQIVGTNDSGNSKLVKVDSVTNSLKSITTDHSNIHLSYGFSISGIFTAIGNGATVNYAFKTPTVASGKFVHWKYREIQATANKMRVDFYENPTNAPVTGADLTAFNRNRVGTPVASAMQAIKANSTIDLTGATMIDTAQFVSNQSRSMDIEWVLKPNTWYIVTLTNLTGGSADANFFEFWYEEGHPA